MTLTLVAVSLNDQPLSQPITAGFDARGGTIGRADHNTMSLPDPQRQVSRLQAEIVAQGPGYLIRNVGAANPITVGTRALGTGETHVLSDGDQIRIAGYLLKVQFDAEDTTTPHLPSRAMSSGPHTRPGAARTSAATPAISASNPFADLMGGNAPPYRTDPFAELMAAPAGVDPRSPSLTPAQSKAPA